MDKVIVNTLNELDKFCKEFSKTLKPGNVVCLTGELGAGKTAFVQAIAKAFNITDQVQSPTFNILLQYKNNEILINHFDLYRLEKQEELEDIGFYEAIESDAFSFIEWAEKFREKMPEDAIWITINKNSSDNRTLEIS